MEETIIRVYLTDDERASIVPNIPKLGRSRERKDNRQVFNGIFHTLRLAQVA